MSKEREKAGKMAELLMEYYINHEFTQINVDIEIKKDSTKIVTEGKINKDKLDIKELESILSNPRVNEYDIYFEGLNVDTKQDDISVLGYLIDDFNIKLEDNTLSIEINRRHN